MTAPLVDRDPVVEPDRLIQDMVPPPLFDAARFATYRPDPEHPSQADAAEAVAAFADGVGSRPSRTGWFRRSRPTQQRPGLYLDGGYGVGKTHLLAAGWHAAPVDPSTKAFCTFGELTHLVGALGFGRTAEALAGHALLCVDEFELDDPGDTMVVTRLLGLLDERGVRFAATSNTLPDRLGEGRFAAEDFLREIQSLSDRFATLRIEGPDYRHRGELSAPTAASDDDVRAAAAAPGVTLDTFDDVLAHLARVHPSRYGPMLDGVQGVGLLGLHTISDQAAALRLVVLVDRLYDRALPVTASGVTVDEVFAPDLLRGGYRKKYRRALSRLTALARPATGGDDGEADRRAEDRLAEEAVPDTGGRP